MRINQFAEKYGVSYQAILHAIKEGIIDAVKNGSQWEIQPTEKTNSYRPIRSKAKNRGQ